MKFHIDFSTLTIKRSFFRTLGLSMDNKGRATGFTIKSDSEEDAYNELAAIEIRWHKWIQAYNYWANDVNRDDTSKLYPLPSQFANYRAEPLKGWASDVLA